jgi:hypothetical protein
MLHDAKLYHLRKCYIVQLNCPGNIYLHVANVVFLLKGKDNKRINGYIAALLPRPAEHDGAPSTQLTFQIKECAQSANSPCPFHALHVSKLGVPPGMFPPSQVEYLHNNHK